ncbi:beta-lactamase-like protein [Mariannaea sp. PMI_226]|nr:beta-lactamase-like protein [Mariannaea sp. PMI_226]
MLSKLFSVVALCASQIAASAATASSTRPVPTYAPVPHSSDGLKLGPDNWRVEPFGHGAYMATDNQYQAMFYISDKGVIVVDAPPTLGHGLLYAIGNTTSIPITHFVYSHYHGDHIGAAYLVHQKGHKKPVIIAHRDTREVLKQLDDPNRPLPNIVFDEDYTLRVGNQTLELSYKGHAHAPGNIFIYAPYQQVLMLVDVVFPGWTPFSGLGRAQFVPGYMKAFDQVLQYKFKHFVGGHLTRSGDRADVKDGREYVHDLRANCIRAIELSGQPGNATNPLAITTLLPPVQEANPRNPWALFREALEAAAEWCADETNKKWKNRIGATDVYGFDNAYTMIESLRLDWDILGPFGVQN